MTTRLLLARHGESVYNHEKRVTGASDVALSGRGFEQARLLAEALSAETLTAVYSSPLTRSRETAAPAAKQRGLPVVMVDALREMSFGALEGRFRDERDPEACALWEWRRRDPVAFRAPGGEDFQDVFARASPWLRRALGAHGGQAFLVVAHRNTNRMILAAALGWSFERAAAQRIRSDTFLDIAIDRGVFTEVSLPGAAHREAAAS